MSVDVTPRVIQRLGELQFTIIQLQETIDIQREEILRLQEELSKSKKSVSTSTETPTFNISPPADDAT